MLIYMTAFGAGILASLSPCVLPVLPIMAGSSASKSKLGPVYLAAGLVISFVAMGLLFSSITHLLGLREETVKAVAAWMLVGFGLILFVPALKIAFGNFVQPIANFAFRRVGAVKGGSGSGQFSIGLLLGAAWGPCVGPTLGIALSLASTESGVPQAGMLMLIFGTGLVLPFLGFAYGFRKALVARRSSLLLANQHGSRILGGSLVLVGGIIISGLDRMIESQLVKALPQWVLAISSTI
jgi:cytochrome c biogenesis protein CcdA